MLVLRLQTNLNRELSHCIACAGQSVFAQEQLYFYSITFSVRTIIVYVLFIYFTVKLEDNRKGGLIKVATEPN